MPEYWELIENHKVDFTKPNISYQHLFFDVKIQKDGKEDADFNKTRNIPGRPCDSSSQLRSGALVVINAINPELENVDEMAIFNEVIKPLIIKRKNCNFAIYYSQSRMSAAQLFSKLEFVEKSAMTAGGVKTLLSNIAKGLVSDTGALIGMFLNARRTANIIANPLSYNLPEVKVSFDPDTKEVERVKSLIKNPKFYEHACVLVGLLKSVSNAGEGAESIVNATIEECKKQKTMSVDHLKDTHIRYTLMEHYSHVYSLYDFLMDMKSKTKRYREVEPLYYPQELYSVLFQTLSAINALAEVGYVHGNINTSNVLLLYNIGGINVEYRGYGDDKYLLNGFFNAIIYDYRFVRKVSDISLARVDAVNLLISVYKFYPDFKSIAMECTGLSDVQLETYVTQQTLPTDVKPVTSMMSIMHRHHREVFNHYNFIKLGLKIFNLRNNNDYEYNKNIGDWQAYRPPVKSFAEQHAERSVAVREEARRRTQERVAEIKARYAK